MSQIDVVSFICLVTNTKPSFCGYLAIHSLIIGCVRYHNSGIVEDKVVTKAIHDYFKRSSVRSKAHV